jgi:hypothetical protein
MPPKRGTKRKGRDYDWDGKKAADRRKRQKIENPVPAVVEYWQGQPFPSRRYKPHRVFTDMRVLRQRLFLLTEGYKNEREEWVGPRRTFECDADMGNRLLSRIECFDPNTGFWRLCIAFANYSDRKTRSRAIERFEDDLRVPVADSHPLRGFVDFTSIAHGVRLNAWGKLQHCWFNQEKSALDFNLDVYWPILRYLEECVDVFDLIPALGKLVMEYLFFHV